MKKASVLWLIGLGLIMTTIVAGIISWQTRELDIEIEYQTRVEATALKITRTFDVSWQYNLLRGIFNEFNNNALNADVMSQESETVFVKDVPILVSALNTAGYLNENSPVYLCRVLEFIDPDEVRQKNLCLQYGAELKLGQKIKYILRIEVEQEDLRPGDLVILIDDKNQTLIAWANKITDNNPKGRMVVVTNEFKDYKWH